MSFAVPRSDRRTSGVGDFEATDVARNIGSLLRFGKVQSVDFEARLCRVELNNGVVTDALPWITVKGGADVFWNAPSVEEVVLLLSPSGELNNAVVLPALQNNPNGTWPYYFSDLEFEWGGLGDPRDAVWRWLFSDGALMENDAERNQFRVEQRQTRLKGSEIAHLRSDKLVFIDGDRDGCVVHVKAPIIKLEGDVQITGQLLQGGRIVGTEPDGNGLKELQLVGDPIRLNGGGGVLGIAAGLVTSFAGGGFSLGGLGSSMAGFGDIGAGLTGLSGILGETGMGTLIDSLPVSGIGAALETTGTLPVLGEMMNGLGFAGTLLTDDLGVASLVENVTSGSGLDLTDAFTGLSSLTSALGQQFNIPALSNLSDLTALAGLAAQIDTNALSVQNFIDVLDGTLEVAGFTPPANVAQALNLAKAATATILDDEDVAVAGPALLGNAMDVVMSGLRSDKAPVTDEQLADRILERGLATAYDGLQEAGANGGQVVGSFITSGAVTLEQVLDMSGVFKNGDDPAETAAAVEEIEAESQQFFEHFNRANYRPDAVTARDTSDKAQSATDPRVTRSPDFWGTQYDGEFV